MIIELSDEAANALWRQWSMAGCLSDDHIFRRALEAEIMPLIGAAVGGVWERRPADASWTLADRRATARRATR